jgi:hypothetical protein
VRSCPVLPSIAQSVQRNLVVTNSDCTRMSISSVVHLSKLYRAHCIRSSRWRDHPTCFDFCCHRQSSCDRSCIPTIWGNAPTTSMMPIPMPCPHQVQLLLQTDVEYRSTAVIGGATRTNHSKPRDFRSFVSRKSNTAPCAAH